MKYRIWMEEVSDIESGWCCGHSERCNSPMHRTQSKKEADSYTLREAVLVSLNYKRSGWNCKVKPKVKKNTRLAVYEGTYES